MPVYTGLRRMSLTPITFQLEPRRVTIPRSFRCCTIKRKPMRSRVYSLKISSTTLASSDTMSSLPPAPMR